MAVPKRKTSRARRDNRRAHHKLSTIALKTCTKCGSKSKPHTVCKKCGNYVK